MKLCAGLASLLLLLVGCTDAEQAPRSSSANAPDAGLVAAVEGVCVARDEALRDADAASSLFLDEAHDGIHRLADDVAAVDRNLAAEVLEAKQRVEAAADASSETRLERALEELATAGADALVALDLEAPSCATEESA